MEQVYLVLSFIGCWYGCVRFPRTKKMNAISAIMLGYMTTICYGALGAFVLSKFKIDISLLHISIVYTIFGVAIWGYIAIRKKTQCLEWRKEDILGALIGTIVIIAICLSVFQIYLHLNYYNTVDPSSHFCMAMDTLRNKYVSGMYFTQFHNAMFMGILIPLLPQTWNYKAFILADCFLAIMEYYVFYAFMIYLLKSKRKKYLPSLISVIYWLGYPLYSLVNGYVYWAMGATIVIYIIWMLCMYEEKVEQRKLCIGLLLLGCFSLCVCYVQFIPCVLVAIVFVLVNDSYKKGNLHFDRKLFIKIVILGIMMCLIAALGYYLIFYSRRLDIFFALRDGVNTSKNLEILTLTPILVFMLYKRFRNKSMNAVLCAGAACYFCYILFVILASLNVMSSYYLFKNNYIFWILIFLIFIECWKDVNDKEKIYIKSYIIVIATFLILMYTPHNNIETTDALSLDNSIYRYNAVLYREKCFRDRYAEKEINLIEYIGQNYDSKNEKVALIGTNLIKGTCQWYGGITNQPFLFKSQINEEVIENYIQESGVAYVAMFYDSDAYEKNRTFIESFEKVYSCDEGIIIRVK